MIQRIQTIWLLIAATLAFLALQFPFYIGNKMVDNIATPMELTGRSDGNFFALICSVAIALLSLIAIFMFKQRKTQVRMVIVAFLLSLVNIVLFIMESREFLPGQGGFHLSSAFVFLIPVFLILAWRGIYKDEKLIKSLDRLR